MRVGRNKVPTLFGEDYRFKIGKAHVFHEGRDAVIIAAGILVAEALKVDRNWLLHGVGCVDGESPIFEHPDDIFVAIRSVKVTAAMGGGAVMEQPAEDGKPYHFQKSWIRGRLKANPADLRIMHVEGEPAAAQLWLVTEGRAVIYKLAYDPRFAHLSVGSILTLRMMRQAIEVDGVREIDYGSGDDAYKKDWMSRRRERWGMVAFNPFSVQGILGIARHGLGRAVAALRGAARRS